MASDVVNVRCTNGNKHRIVGLSGNCVAAVLVLILAFFQPDWLGNNAFSEGTSRLRIAVLEKSNRVLREDEQFRLTVEVRSDLKTPVEGADVSFIAPDSGPGILFANNAVRRTVKTDSHGRADTGWARSIGDGLFLVTIVASYQGESASTSTQAGNQGPVPSTNGAPKKSGKLKWILIAAAAAGVVGVVLATKKSDSESSSGSMGNSGPTITLGPPTVGAPQ